MCIIGRLYEKKFLTRYDKDGIIPYLSYKDFDGLECETGAFSSDGIKISYFVYRYENVTESTTIVFCHGLGAGHTAYMREIEYFCKKGFKVIACDWAGCDSSEGKGMISMNEPTKNLVDLIGHLGLKEDFVVVGHSLGGYTALNAVNALPFIRKAVIISGFLSVKSALSHALGSRFLANRIDKYEKRRHPEYAFLDNYDYLKKTDDELLFIASKDDAMVEYDNNTGFVAKLGRDNIKVLTEEGKKHNPNYSASAIKYMNETFGEYYRLVKEKKLKTHEEKAAFFADKSAYRMTDQDERVMGAIIDFIKG